MARHSETAVAIARFLEAHSAVSRVHYPGLPSSPSYDLARRQMANGGGLVSFELAGGQRAGLDLMNRLKLVTRAVSLGAAETLIQHPASMTHATYSPEERARHGIEDGLIRLSAGLENLADIQDDLAQALDRVPR